MKAVEASFLMFLKKSPQFIIPIYQRTYSWLERECLQLWNDIIRAGSSDKISGHFVGSIVYIEKGIYHVSAHTPLLVIDGQQRLTTISLILEALARKLVDSEPVAGFSAKKIRHFYLLNTFEEGESAYKLILTQTDKNSLFSLMNQKKLPKDYSIRIKDNFDFFTQKIEQMNGNYEILCKGLEKLIIVDIALNRDHDNPQLIFESMNSTGKELSQADLIRNYVLMGLEPQHQTNLYLEHWRPMEVDFGQEAYDTHFDRFMRHYLTFKTGEIPNINRVYESFKNYSNTKDIAISGVDALVADIHTFSIYYCNMVLGKEQDKKLGEAFQDIREFKMDVAYPFLLELYHDFKTGILSHDDFYEALRLVESYVFRRAVCNIPTNSLNKTFASFGKALQKDRYLESIQAYLITIPSYRRFPDDEEFKREFSTRDLYNFARRSYWLRRIENFGRKERVPVTEYTIEHILPQNESLSVEWQKDLGENWKRIQEAWLHTLGNLTLTGYNSEYSDRSFKTKRDMVGGFKESPLRLNEGVGNLNIWNEDSIKNRAEKLSNLALLVWKRPSLSSEKLDLFKKKPERKLLYSFDDHPYLTSSAPMRPLFEDFRKQVLTIDEVVVEEVLKLYIAYKAETNFVDVIPQAGRLLLSINIPFHEIDDPKKLCRNVKGIGRWGNGEVEVGISSIDELPYVMGLIRQAFEKQMGNGEIE